MSNETNWRDAAERSLEAMYQRALAAEAEIERCEARPLYVCPDGHRWTDESEVEVPLVNMKCPHCGVTAMRRGRSSVVRRWVVQPLRTLVADVPADPFSRIEAP